MKRLGQSLASEPTQRYSPPAMRFYAVINLIAVLVLLAASIHFFSQHQQKGWIPLGIALADIAFMSVMIVLARSRGRV